MEKNNTHIGMERRTKIITEYRQTGGDADGNSIVGIGWGWGCCWWEWVQNILPCHSLVQSSMPLTKLSINCVK